MGLLTQDKYSLINNLLLRVLFTNFFHSIHHFLKLTQER